MKGKKIQMNKSIANDMIDLENQGKKMNFARRIQKRISSSPYAYLFYCFIIPVVINYLVYLAMEIHPFGDGSVLVLDLNAQYVYFYEALRDFVYGDANLLYSFSRNLGGEFVGIYAYYIASPLSYIVALFPKDRMLEALLTLFLLKTGLCGVTFGFYLHKHSRSINKVYILMFSCMYALSSYAMVQQNNNMWIDALIWLPLLTLGIEQLIKFGKFKLFVIALAFTIWSNYYIGYMVCIYTAAYFFFYMYAFEDDINNPRGERSHFLRSFIRIAVFSLLGVAMAAFMILGAYYSLTFGKNTFTSPDFTPKMKFEVLDFLTKFLPGAYDTVRPEGLPFVYCGLLTVILIPVFFLSKKFRSREKIASICFIGFFCICFIVSTLDIVWHGFQNPNWLNHRYSFMLSFFLLTLAYKGLSALSSVSEKFMLGITGFIVLFVAVAEKQKLKTFFESDEKLLTFQTVWFSIILAIFFFVVLCLLKKSKRPKAKENISALLAVVVCIELFVNGITMFVQLDKDVVFTDYTPYTSYLLDMREAVDPITEEDRSFYRMETNHHRQINDNFALSINGLSGSTSTLNKETISFLKNLGYASQSHWSNYKGGNPVNDSLLGVKYIVDTRAAKISPLYYEPISTSTKYIVYKNPYALSISYGVDDKINSYDMSIEKSPIEQLNHLVGSMLGYEDSAEIFTPVDTTSIEHDNCNRSFVAGHISFEKKNEQAATVTIKATAMQEGEFFFYAPSDYTRPVKLAVNGTSKGTYFDGESDRIISLGTFHEGDNVTVKLTLDESTDLYLLDNCPYFYHIDTEKLDECMTALCANPQLITDNDCPDNHITGSLTTTKENQTMITSIPYDKGWKIFVDGKEVQTYKALDAVIAFNVNESGAHTVEMKYDPIEHKLGAIISISATVIFILICLTELILKKVFKKFSEKEPVSDVLWALDDIEADQKALSELTEQEKKQEFSFKKLISIFNSKSTTAENDKSEDDLDKTSESNDQNDNQNGGN